MDSRSWMRRTGATVAAALAVAVLLPSIVAARPAPRRARPMNLFSAPGFLVQVNRVQCGLDNIGQVCVAFSGSPVAGGGFWPKGTPDQYIFNSGLQIAAVVDTDGGPWAGDTVGAFFFDPRGDQQNGDPVTEIFSTLDPQDAANWPPEALVLDTAIYNNVLINRNNVSEGDAWVRYWEGNPTQLGGRLHPMGVLVDQRAMAWNFPSGNEDIIYFVFKFYNVTASDPAVYNNPDIEPQLQAGIAAVGAQFHSMNNTKFGITLPAGGYTLRDMYAAFAMDNDVAQYNQNYSTAVLPFNLGVTYSGNFEPEVGWIFPPTIFGDPFFAGSGFIGAKYLKSPVNPNTQEEVGLTMFSNTTNGPPFADAQGVNLLYRRLSGFLGGGDTQCNPFTNPATARLRRLCYLAQAAADARFYQASGPFNLAPGRAATIVVAYVHAAPVDIGTNLVGGDLAPGVPATGDTIFARPSAIRTIDRVMGWVSQSDDNSNSIIEQEEVATVERSLLNKSLVAQAVFDNKFLLPFAPTAPQFYLVPGDNQVSVVWQASPSETAGDPFFEIASQPTVLDPETNTPTPNPLYDPNFRRLDVEGYRIYRGRTSSELELIAQFDYSGTTFVDYTAAIDYGDANGDGLAQCAPELGLADPVPVGDCPVAFATAPPFTDSVETSLIGEVVQVRPGGRVLLASGGVLVLSADTLITGGGSGFEAPSDNGVPFAFVDHNVLNSFTYHYTVTAFDVNSVKSGPSSLESPRITRTVVPRKPSSNLVLANLNFEVIGGDGAPLDPGADWDINPTTGRFTGPPPPTAATQLEGTFAPLIEQLLPVLDLTMTIDSVRGRTDEDFPCLALGNIQAICFEYFVTYQRATETASFRTPVYWPILESAPFNEAAPGTGLLGNFPVSADSASAARFGIPNGFSEFNASVGVTLQPYIRYSAHENQSGRRLLANVSPGGSRWFEGADETLDHPAIGLRAGHVTGVDTIYHPLSHIDNNPYVAGVDNYAPPFADGAGQSVSTNMQCTNYVMSAMGRQADVEVTWGAGGTIASVHDVTHRVDVPFRNVPDGSYGFIGDANGNGKIDWRDFDLLETVAQSNQHLGFCAGTDPGPGNRALLVNQPVIMSVSTAGASPTAALAGMPTTGTGFGMYIIGHRFIFQLSGGTPPAAGTKWTLRSYAGMVSATTAPASATPSGYTYAPVAGSPAVPGLRILFSVEQPTSLVAENVSLENVHTVPDPYYVANAYEVSANNKILKFVNLPARAIIRIYSVSGVLVAVVPHDDVGGGGEANWNLRNRNNQFIASGVYFYHVETPEGRSKVGRFTVVNFAP